MFRPFSLYIGMRYANLKGRGHFITFISWVSMLGIALGVMVLVTVLSVMNGFTSEIQDRILSVTPHILVQKTGSYLNNWPAVANQLANDHKQIQAYGPFIEGQGMLAANQVVRGLMIKGVDPNHLDGVFPLKETLISGDITKLKTQKFGIILGANLAKSLNLKVGDSVTLIIPEVSVSIAGATPRLKRLEVIGIFEIGYLYDSSYGFININDAAKIFRTHNGVSGIQLRVADPFDAPQIAYKINKNLRPFYYAQDWASMNETYFSAVKMEKTMMFFTLLMILAIAVFNLISTLVMVVTDKRADIAIMRTLGASKQKIMAIFIAQGAVIGVIGTILGVALGVTLALNVTDLVAFIERIFKVELLSSEVYFISFLPSKLELKDVILIASSSVGLSLLATIHPAFSAAKIEPAKALRNEA